MLKFENCWSRAEGSYMEVVDKKTWAGWPQNSQWRTWNVGQCLFFYPTEQSHQLVIWGLDLAHKCVLFGLLSVWGVCFLPKWVSFLTTKWSWLSLFKNQILCRNLCFQLMLKNQRIWQYWACISSCQQFVETASRCLFRWDLCSLVCLSTYHFLLFYTHLHSYFLPGPSRYLDIWLCNFHCRPWGIKVLRRRVMWFMYSLIHSKKLIN